MGTRIEERPGLGRVLVATHDFAIGELVLDEAPLIVYQGFDDYLEKYVSLPNEKQLALLDMFHPPLDKDTAVVMATRTQAVVLAKSHAEISTDLIHKLLMISHTNAHQYFGQVDVYTERVVNQCTEHLATKRSALFDVGSKVAHACCPNVVNSTKNEKGHIHFRAIRPIKAGDHVAMSYLADIWTTTTAQRQQQLLHGKDFLCACQRCVAPDDCRVLTCPKQCGQVVKFAPKAVVAAHWICSTCGDVSELDMKDTLSRELALVNKVSEIQERVHAGRLHHYPPATLEKLVSEIARCLSPTHYLVVQALNFMATVCVSQANDTEQAMQATGLTKGPFGTPAQLRLLAADAGLRSARVCECIVARCHGGDRCIAQHAVAPECATCVFHAGQDLLAAGPDSRTSDSAVAVSRYFPSMRLNFGEHDADVKGLEVMVEVVLAKERRGQHPSQLPQGCDVLLHSLQSGAEHNGKKGIVKQYLPDKQRYTVEVCRKQMSLKASNLLQLVNVLCGGQEGMLTGFSGEGLEVSIQGALRTCSMDEVTLLEGARVRLKDLTREEFNGKVVEIRSFDSKSGRYHVQMDKTTAFSVPPSKISLRL